MKIGRLISLILLIFSCAFIPIHINALTKNEQSNGIWSTTANLLYYPFALFFPHYEQREIIYQAETPNFHIVVEKDSNNRNHLVFLPRRGSQSIYSPEEPTQIISAFIRNAMLSLALLGKPPKNALFLGLGGGIMPGFLGSYFPDCKITVVEIEGRLPEIAEKYFGFKRTKNINIEIEDGRVFVNNASETFDLIVIDVYNAYNIPFQFTTMEFYEQIKKILNQDGVCAVNIANMGNKEFIASELNTIFSVFPERLIFETKNRTNIIPLLTKKKIELSKIKKNAKTLDESKKFNLNFNQLIKNRLEPSRISYLRSFSDEILTDNFCPEYLMYN